MRESSRSYITEANLNILSASSNKRVGHSQRRHGSSINLPRHLKIHNRLPNKKKQSLKKKKRNIILKFDKITINQSMTWAVLVSQTLTRWSKEPVTKRPVSMGYQTAEETANLCPCSCPLSTLNTHLCFPIRPLASVSVARWVSNTAAEPSDAPDSKYLPSVKSTWFS